MTDYRKRPDIVERLTDKDFDLDVIGGVRPVPLVERIVVERHEAAAEITRLRSLVEEAGKVVGEIAEGPGVPAAYKWSGDDGLEGMFDPELRHKNGSKPVDYLRAWLSMLRPFAFATKDDSWGELEKLICIVMRNYVRMTSVREAARSLSTKLKGEGQ